MKSHNLNRLDVSKGYFCECGRGAVVRVTPDDYAVDRLVSLNDDLLVCLECGTKFSIKPRVTYDFELVEDMKVAKAIPVRHEQRPPVEERRAPRRRTAPGKKVVSVTRRVLEPSGSSSKAIGGLFDV